MRRAIEACLRDVDRLVPRRTLRNVGVKQTKSVRHDTPYRCVRDDARMPDGSPTCWVADQRGAGSCSRTGAAGLATTATCRVGTGDVGDWNVRWPA